MLPLSWVMWISFRSQLLHRTKQTHLAQATEKLKKDPGEHGAVTGPATASLQLLSEPQIGDKVCVLQNGCRFTAILQISHKNFSWAQCYQEHAEKGILVNVV